MAHKSPELKHTSFDDVMMEDEDKDKFLEISLSDPSKVGEGISSYMVYKLTCKTNFPMFKKPEFGTSRRFSDFLSLYEKLKEKHMVVGRILPPAPEKDMLGTAKVKMSKEEAIPSVDFIGKRRAALERFLNRLGKHKTFRYDPDFRDFLEIESELPKATNTSALSGAGMVKMFKNLTESVSKISIKMENDLWFDEKKTLVDNLHQQLSKLHGSIELLYGWRKSNRSYFLLRY
jgi:sorting nexin-1/2